jgi:hypothetical protein
MEPIKHVAFSSAHLDRGEPWMLISGGDEDWAIGLGETGSLTWQLPAMEREVFPIPGKSYSLSLFQSSLVEADFEVGIGTFSEIWPSGPSHIEGGSLPSLSPQEAFEDD